MACSSSAGAIQIAGTPKAGSRVSLPVSGPPPRLARDGQQMRALGLPAADLDAAQRDHILPRLQAQVVRDMHGRHQKAHLRREVPAQRAHPAQQLPALLLVDQRNQLEADLERQIFEAQQRRQIGALRAFRLFFLARRQLRRQSRRRLRRQRACRRQTAPRPRPETRSSAIPESGTCRAETALAI